MWILVAGSLDQSIWQLQHSRDLVTFGAIRGFDFEPPEIWRALASQWLHVSFPHMLFNALMIGIVGQAVEERMGGLIMVLVGAVGGALAQLSTVFFNSSAYISGASQAYLALCGLALLTITKKSVGWWAALVGTLVAIALDLFVSSHGAPKVGHVTGFAAGAFVGVLVRWNGSRYPREHDDQRHASRLNE